MAPSAPAVRVLPNAVTVLALCSGLSAVQFALMGYYQFAVTAIGIAAVLDGVDGRIARLLDATSKIGAELDSLSDAVAFGVSPALVIYIWSLHVFRTGWVISLIFAVCMVLRLARFNTLLDDNAQPPFAKEFFVGVPAPAGALLAMLPLALSLQVGTGWWSTPIAVAPWTIAIAALLISRIPTLSLKTIKVSQRAIAFLLVLVGLLAAAIITFPLGALVVAMVLYLAHLPYAMRRYQWLRHHPEAWDVPPRERRAIRRASGARRLGLRPPRLRRVAGAARRAVGFSRRDTVRANTLSLPAETVGHPPTAATPRRVWRRVGLRREGSRRVGRTNRPEPHSDRR